MTDQSTVTVVMITRNRCASAVRSVDELVALPERPEVVVVDNGSSDGTASALADLPRVRVLQAGRNLASAGRNLGVREARTPYVAFADDDSWWEPGSLAAAVELLHRHRRLAVLTARTLVGSANADDPMNAELAAAPLGSEPDLPGPSVLGFLACAAVVRRSAFLAAGGFHPRFGVGGEEQLLALDLLSAGWGLAYVPDLIAHHHPEPGAERAGRRAQMVRNELWTAWLRRRPPAVAAATLSVLRRAVTDDVAREGARDALAGRSWVLRERRPIPRLVEAALDRAQHAGPTERRANRSSGFQGRGSQTTTGISRSVHS